MTRNEIVKTLREIVQVVRLVEMHDRIAILTCLFSLIKINLLQRKNGK